MEWSAVQETHRDVGDVQSSDSSWDGQGLRVSGEGKKGLTDDG